MPRTRKAIPLNETRTFRITLDYRLFENLVLLHNAEIFGIALENIAENLVLNYLLEKRKNGEHEQLGLSWEDAESRGYIPMESASTVKRFQQSPNLKVRFGGMARYSLEMLPKAEPEPCRNLTNPFYQKNPEYIILKILKKEVPQKLNEARKSGLIDNNESYL